MDIDILISIIVGFVFGYLISDKIINPPIIHGPNSADIVNRVYEVDKRKYKFEPRIYPSFIKII